MIDYKITTFIQIFNLFHDFYLLATTIVYLIFKCTQSIYIVCMIKLNHTVQTIFNLIQSSNLNPEKCLQIHKKTSKIKICSKYL